VQLGVNRAGVGLRIVGDDGDAGERIGVRDVFVGDDVDLFGGCDGGLRDSGEFGVVIPGRDEQTGARGIMLVQLPGAFERTRFGGSGYADFGVECGGDLSG